MTAEIDLINDVQDNYVLSVRRGLPRRIAIGKRLFDLVVCIVFLPFLLIMMAMIAILIVLDSPGSPFFVQERVGKDRRRFRIYKFRTMCSDHDPKIDQAFMQAYVSGRLGDVQSGETAIYKPMANDSITRLGRILRKTSLDELPQVANILRGEMSLIGPRPNVIWEVDNYKEWHYRRLDVLPGITGYAQVHGRSSIPFDQIVRYDIEYIQNYSWQMDFRIIWLTFLAVLKRSGVR